MKRLVAAVLIASMLTVGGASLARAHQEADVDEYEDAFSNPVRLAYYLAYPAGFTIEWLVMRPFHYLISRPYLDKIFGYQPIGEEGTYSRMGEHM